MAWSVTVPEYLEMPRKRLLPTLLAFAGQCVHQAWRRRGSSSFCPLRLAFDNRWSTRQKENRRVVLLSLDFRKQSRSLDDEMTFCITKEKQSILVPLGLPSWDSGLWELLGPSQMLSAWLA